MGTGDEKKRKATFNISESTHQGLKLAAVVQRREMVELVEEALGAYFEWTKMTRIELDELEMYRTAEFLGEGRKMESNFHDLCRKQGYVGSEVLAQLLSHLHLTKLLLVEVNDGRTGWYDFLSFPEGPTCFLRHGGAIRLQVTIPGRLRFQQLQVRRDWEQRRHGESATPGALRILRVMRERGFIMHGDPTRECPLFFLPTEIQQSKRAGETIEPPEARYVAELLSRGLVLSKDTNAESGDRRFEISEGGLALLERLGC